MGLGNFRTVDVEDLTKHKMDSEKFMITQEAADIVNNGKTKKKESLRYWYFNLKGIGKLCYYNRSSETI